MDNLRPRVFFQKRFRQQPDDVVPLDKLPFLIEQEAAVEVAVKGDAMSAPCSITALRVSSRHSGSNGLGMPFGKVPSGVLWILMNSTGAPSAFRRASMASMTGPAAPLPALNTSFSGVRLLTLI
ncbi:Uncharacterised protein [Salmonella enterica subsp. enterica serovar Havana]|nr:Uncharacterised protein [Salmonella enterica subsp. enterica serovar Havana]